MNTAPDRVPLPADALLEPALLGVGHANGAVSAEEVTAPRSSPFWWVPTAFLSMGIGYIVLTNVTSIMFKNLGMDNGRAAEYASYFILAYTIKPLFSPIVEMYRTKKFFVVAAQFGIGIGFGAAALAMSLPSYIPALIAIFWVISFLGSTQDIATDGVFITALDRRMQSLFSGVQSLSWNCAPVIASGGLVYLSGRLHGHFLAQGASGDAAWVSAWQIVFAVLAAGCLVFPFWHLRAMPDGAHAVDTPDSLRSAGRVMKDTFVTFFRKPGVGRMIVFLLFYQSSVGLLEKTGPFFMVDPVARGGLGLDNQLLGLIYGVYGLAAVLGGSVLGGVLVSRYGVKRTLFYACIALNVPNVTFLLMALYRPESLAVIAVGVMIEKFFYGFGLVAFVVYMMQQVAPGRYMTAHFAFATGLKGLGMMLTGMVSGHLQLALGYQMFFGVMMLASIPSFLATWFAPFPNDERPPAPDAA